MFSFYFKSKTKTSQLKANEWVNQVTEKMNAKGGGKENAAQATGTNTTNINECIDLASQFAKLKLNN